MILNCRQVEMLLSFYIDGDLSYELRKSINDHLSSCISCKNKYDLLKNFYMDMENSYANFKNTLPESMEKIQDQHSFFRNNLSAYIDNELSDKESLKLKKYAINNSKAKQEMEKSYRLKSMLKNAFDRTKMSIKSDFSEKVIADINTSNKLNRIDFYLKTTAAIIIICIGAITFITIMMCI